MEVETRRKMFSPSVSIKDRPLLAVLIEDGTVLTAYRE